MPIKLDSLFTEDPNQEKAAWRDLQERCEEKKVVNLEESLVEGAAGRGRVRKVVETMALERTIVTDGAGIG